MTPLERRLVDEIRSNGPITFAEYMERALYDSEDGYYATGRQRTGWDGHFVTSPELDPSFGRLWAKAFEEVWDLCDRPPSFTVTEIGAGEGGFAASVFEATTGEFAAALTYRIVERVRMVEERQRAALADRGRVEWVPDIAALAPAAHGCLFANEVLDNLAVHVLEKRDGTLLEWFVDAAAEGLVVSPGPPSTPGLERRVRTWGVDIVEGGRMEVPVALEAFIAGAARGVGRGAIVWIDYGAPAPELARRSGETLVAYSDHGVDEDLLARPGEKDITAQVNWTAVGAACVRAGLKPGSPLPQRDVLVRLGLAEIHDSLRVAHSDALAQGRGAEAVRALSRRQALGALADPGGLGGLDVIVATTGIETPSFAA